MSRGRLGLSLELPPYWQRQGVYSARRELGKLCVHNKLENCEKERNPHMLSSVDVTTVHIRSNYFEKSAIIVDASGFLRVQAILLLPI